jgi:hypothetical protein
MVVRGAQLERERPVAVPDSFRATGATFSNVTGKGQPRALVFVDPTNRLRIATGTSEVWSSASLVGGGATQIPVERLIERGGRTFFYRLEPIPLSIDLDGDGVEEVLIPQNQVEGMLAVIYRGPAGMRYQQVNSGFDGVIAAISGFPSEDSTAPTLVAAVIRYGNILKTFGETQLIMTVPQE